MLSPSSSGKRKNHPSAKLLPLEQHSHSTAPDDRRQEFACSDEVLPSIENVEDPAVMSDILRDKLNNTAKTASCRILSCQLDNQLKIPKNRYEITASE